MNRALLLLPMAALAGGCYVADPCDPPYLNIYWIPGPSPNAGFQVPGLVANGFASELDCAGAGVSSVQATIEGQILSCPVGTGNCVDANTWLCPVGGLSIPISSEGTYEVQVDGFDANGNLKYASGPVLLPAGACGDSAAGVFPQGVAGTLGIDYAFSPAVACQPSSQIVWDLRRGTSSAFDAGATTCGGTNPFLANGGALVGAGVYTLVNIAEVAGGTSFHAACSSTPFVHAGPETVQVDMPVSTGACF